MDLKEALAPDVDPEEFFVDKIPALFEARRELFASACDTAIIVSVHLMDTGERYTLEFSPEGCRVEKGEMIDFPVVTIAGSSQNWQEVKRHVLQVAEPLEKRAHKTEVPRKVTRDFLDKLERHDGEFVFDLSADDLDQPIPIKLILNDYEPPPGAPTLRVSASFDLGVRLARGDIKPSQVESEISVRGDMSLGLDVGGLILKEFPELEG